MVLIGLTIYFLVVPYIVAWAVDALWLQSRAKKHRGHDDTK